MRQSLSGTVHLRSSLGRSNIQHLQIYGRSDVSWLKWPKGKLYSLETLKSIRYSKYSKYKEHQMNKTGQQLLNFQISKQHSLNGKVFLWHSILRIWRSTGLTYQRAWQLLSLTSASLVAWQCNTPTSMISTRANYSQKTFEDRVMVVPHITPIEKGFPPCRS